MAGLAAGDSSQLGASERGSHKMANENSEDGGHWYFSRKEIENSPSRRDGIDLKKETYIRKSYCTFLQDLGMRLKVPQVTIATAIIFCHRFYLRQSHAMNDRRTIATACMFLAGKVEETPRPLKDVILVSYEIIHKKDNAAIQKIKQKEVYEQQKELILLGERVVLSTLAFDMNVQHPYKPLVEAIKKFKVAQNALAQVAWNFVNDGLRTSLCLQFKTHHIAAGAIFLAAKFLKVKLPSDGEKVWWQEFDVTPRQLEEVSNQMLELYEQNRAPAIQASEGEASVAGEAGNQQASSTLAEEEVPNINSSQAGAATKAGSLNPETANHFLDHSSKHVEASRSSQNQINDHVRFDYKTHIEPRAAEPLGQEESLRDGQLIRCGTERSSGEDSKVKNVGGNRAREWGDSEGKSLSNYVEVKEPVQTEPQAEIIEKIDANKLKEIREKRRKSRNDVIRKKDSIDEFDPILKELEDGVELAVAENEKSKQDKKQNWSNRPQLHVLGDMEKVDEGEESVLEDSGCDYQSPKSNDRRRKAGSPLDKANDGKRWRDSTPEDCPDNKNRTGRGDYPDRDHKRHLQENRG